MGLGHVWLTHAITPRAAASIAAAECKPPGPRPSAFAAVGSSVGQPSYLQPVVEPIVFGCQYLLPRHRLQGCPAQVEQLDETEPVRLPWQRRFIVCGPEVLIPTFLHVRAA